MYRAIEIRNFLRIERSLASAIFLGNPAMTLLRRLWNQVASAASTKGHARPGRRKFFRPEIELLGSRTLFAVRVWAGGAVPVTERLDAITTKPRFGLVEPQSEGYRLDIRFRMLQPGELARAMSFDDYQFSGSKADQVRQIGNAVPVRTAQALCEEILRASA